jgi:amino acid permease
MEQKTSNQILTAMLYAVLAIFPISGVLGIISWQGFCTNLPSSECVGSLKPLWTLAANYAVFAFLADAVAAPLASTRNRTIFRFAVICLGIGLAIWLVVGIVVAFA